MPLKGLVGLKKGGDNAPVTPRQGTLADTIVSGLHGDFAENTYRGGVYSFGISNTQLVQFNGIADAIDQTSKPIIGLWNPPNTGKVLAILSASIVVTNIPNSAVSIGGFQWEYALNQNAITTGSNPICLCNFGTPGTSQAKVFSCSTAITGLSGNLAVLRAAGIVPCLNAAGEATALMRSWFPEERTAGTIIVLPGTFVGIRAALTQNSAAAVSVSTNIMWEELYQV